MVDYKVDYDAKEIVLTRQFANLAMNPDNKAENNKLKKTIAMYPTFDVVVRKIKKSDKKKRTFKGLTLEFMETYITLYGTAKQLLQLSQLKILTRGANAGDRFQLIRSWFFNEFEGAMEIEDYELEHIKNQLELIEKADSTAATA